MSCVLFEHCFIIELFGLMTASLKLTLTYIMFSGCPSARFVSSLVRSSGQILLPLYLMNGLSNETYRQ